MPVKLSEIDRLMVEKQDTYECMNFSCISDFALGFNQAIDQLGSRSIGINRERLVKLIIKRLPYMYVLSKEDKNFEEDTIGAELIADAIIAKENELIEYKEVTP